MGDLLLSFTIPGVPVAWARTTGGRHTPKKQRAHSTMVRDIAWAARVTARWSHLHDPVKVYVLAVWPRPKKVHHMDPCYGNPGRVWRPAVPDIDNIAKQVLDGVGGSGVWDDDRQVCQIIAEKVWAAEGESPGTHVTITSLKTEEPYG